MSDLKTWYSDTQLSQIGSGKAVLNTVNILAKSLQTPELIPRVSNIFEPFSTGVKLWREVRNHASYTQGHCAAMLVQMAIALELESAIQSELGFNPIIRTTPKADLLQRELPKQSQRFEDRTLDLERIPSYRLSDNKLVRMSQVLWTAWFNVVEYQSGNEWQSFNSKRLLTISRQHLSRRIFSIVQENWETLPEMAQYLKLVDGQGLSQHASQLKYLTSLASSERRPLFNSAYSYRDLYVPLEAFVLEEAEWSNRLERQELVDLFSRMEKSLSDTSRVTFVEGGVGTGKSMFCSMLGAYMAKNALVSNTPQRTYFPVLLSLEQLQQHFLHGTFEECLNRAMDALFPWSAQFLASRPMLFILDGFDALMPALSRERGSLRSFFAELEAFQNRWQHLPSELPGHKVFVTGRPMALETRRIDVPDSFERLEVAPFSSQQIEQWLENWARDEIAGAQAAERLKEELTSNEVFSQFGSYQQPTIIQQLASNPLFLHLLALMSQNGKFPHPQDFDLHRRTDLFHSFFRHIYKVSFQDGNPVVRAIRKELNLGQEDILQIVREMGYLIYQQGGQGVRLSDVQKRLEQNYFNTALLQNPESVRSLLRNFHLCLEDSSERLKPSMTSPLAPKGKILFYHRSMMEYQTAERLLQVIEELVERRKFVGTYNRRPRFTLRIETAARLYYDNFGLMHPNLEVMQYLDGFLPWLFYWEGNEEKSQTREEIRQVRQRYPLTDLIQRLEELFTFWLNGEWSYKGFATQLASQTTLHTGRLKPHLIELSTGFSLLEMLSRCRQHLGAGLDFHNNSEVSKDWLNRMYAYASFNNQSEFWFQLTRFLSYANLHACDLSRLDLCSATLTRADLQFANLQHVDLQYANLQETRMQNANLQHANLQKADLTSANLVDANLHSALLMDANLTDVYLLEANLIEARLQNANLENVKLQYARLNDAKLQNANLRNAKLQKADLTGADLRGADLTGADLRGAEIAGARLEGTRGVSIPRR